MDKSSSLSTQIAAGLALILALLGGILAIIAFNRTPMVTTNEIVDGTIQERDLQETLRVGLKLSDGQLITGDLVTENFDKSKNEGAVLGIEDYDGSIPVIVKDDKLVVDLGAFSGQITTEHIKDGTLQPEDFEGAIIVSINGVSSETGNINLVGDDNISIIAQDDSDHIHIQLLEGSGSGLDADTLDGNDSSFYRNASNINSGTLGTDYYSAYNDLGVEGYLDFNNDADLVTKGQADSEYVNADGDTMTGDLIMDGADIIIDNGGNLYVDGTTVLGGDLIVLGESYHFGPETYFDDIDAQDRILNSGGTLLLDDDTQITGNTDVLGYLFNSTGDVVINDNLVPGADSTYNLGALGNEWANLFVDNVTGCLTSPGTGSSYCDDAVINGTLTVNGDSTVNGNSIVTGTSDLQGDIFNSVGDVVVNDVLRTTGNVFLGNSDGDRVTINGVISSGDSDPVIIQDNQGLLIERRDNGNDLFSVDGNGVATFHNDALPGTDSAYDLGAVGMEWANLYVDNIFANNIVGCLTSTGTGSSYCDDANINGTLTVNGTSTLNGNTDITGTLHATGNVDFDSNLNVDGNTTLQGTLDVNGVSNLNNAVNINGLTTVTGNVVSGADSTYDLGAVGNEWANLFVDNIVASNITGCLTSPGTASSYCDDASINGSLTVTGISDLQGTIVNSTGNVVINDNADVTGNLVVSLDSNLNGNTTIGDSAADTVYFNALVGSNIIPTTNDAFDLGSAALRFQDGFFSDSVRVGATGNQTRYENGLIRRVGGSLDIETTAAGLITLSPNGTPIVTVQEGNGPEAGPVATVYEVSIQGDLEVTGTIDPTAILFNPINDGQIVIQVDDTTSTTVFTVDENGNVIGNSFNGDINGCVVSAGTSSSYCDNATINGSLGVNGTTALNGNTDITGALHATGNTDLDANLAVDGNTTLGDAAGDTIDARGTISNSTGNVVVNDRLIVTESIGSGDADQLIIADNQGLLVERQSDGFDLFSVDSNGSITVADDATITDDATIGGDLTVNGNVSINAQLSVNDLLVTGVANIANVDSDLIPDAAGYDLGANTASGRWDNVYANFLDISNDVTILGSLTVNGTNVETALGALDTRLDTAEIDIANLQTDVAALQARQEVISGVTACAVAVTDPTTAANCVVNFGANISSATFTPISGSANPNIRLVLTADPTGSSSVTLKVTGNGASLSAISWVAVLQ